MTTTTTTTTTTTIRKVVRKRVFKDDKLVLIKLLDLFFKIITI